jgi:hypothetical protein
MFVALLCSVLLISCGGGSSAGPPPPPSGDFSISVEVPTVTIQQGGASQLQNVQVNFLNGLTGTVSLNLSGLPSGIVATPPGPFSLATPASFQAVFQLAASTSATVGGSTVTLTATNGALTHTATFQLKVTSVAPFSIRVSPTALSLTPGASATVEVSLTSNSSISSPLNVDVAGPPDSAGINVEIPRSLLTSTSPVSFVISPTAFAQPLQNYPVVITVGDSPGSPQNSSVFVLPLTVNLPYSTNNAPTRSNFVRTDQGPTNLVYDQLRRLVFVSIEVLNEVRVLSSVDGHQVASIPVNYPAGIDESVDGSAVYVVSPYFGGVTIIDPNLLQVVGHADVPKNVSGSSLPLSFFSVDTLSNGKVILFLAARDEFAILPPIYLWDPRTETFANIGPSPPPPSLNAAYGLIQRSADHSKVLVWAAGTSNLYDAASGTFSTPSNSVTPTAALSPDGSHIVSVDTSGGSTTLMDNNFNVLASLQLGMYSVAGVVYSQDGKRVYVMGHQIGAPGMVAAVIDAKTFTMAGLVPSFSFGTSLPFSGQWVPTFATDETNMLFGAALRGVGFLDMSAPTSLQPPPLIPFSVEPRSASLSSPTQATLNGAGFSQSLSMNLYLGAPAASPSALKATNISVQSTATLTLTVPTGTAAGPVNATLTRSDGFFEVMPDAISFGPTILQVDADTGSPAGNDLIWIHGYGLNSSNTQVTIGGRAATDARTSGGIYTEIFPTDSIRVKTPPGTPGKADVTVTTPHGSTTASKGFHYLNLAQVYPAVGALDAIVYDQKRQRLYATNEDHNRVEIFDLATSQFLSPISVGNSPTALAMTPDGNLLGVINRLDGTISVVNLVTMQGGATYPLLTAADTDKVGCGGVVLSISPASPHRMLVDLQCTADLYDGKFHLINLDTGSLACTGVVGCASNGTDIIFGNGLAAMASSPDGTKIFLAGNSGGGSALPVGLLDVAANTLRTGFTSSGGDAAMNADADCFAANFAIGDAQLNLRSMMAFELYTDSNSYSTHNLTGEKLNASGSLFYVPQDTGVDIFDVHTGRLVRHIVTPEPLPHDSGPLALDESGTKIFLISNSGITIVQLDEVPLSLATVNPTSGPSGTSAILRGSGFENGATVKFDDSPASTTFVDSSTLKVTVPSRPVGASRITVVNADGSTYSFDNAFTVR